MNPSTPQSIPSAENGWVAATTDATFHADVVERSQQVPVVVDFWAEWCAPCRALAPTLEKLAGEFGGNFLLVKAETEVNQEAAMRLGVQGIPAVFALYQGEVVDFFDGARPADFVRRWLEGVTGRAELAAATATEATDARTALEKYRELAARQPQWAAVQAGIARCLLALGERPAAAEVISQLERRGFLEPEAEQVKAQLALSGPAADLSALRGAANAAPHDWALQLQLAQALAAAGEHEECLQRALAVVQNDRRGAGEEARQLMVNVFHVLPDESELAATFRKQLAMALY